eukprot:TRINITY_DN5109_c0_g1_i1.p1 TRINITY_DN5109_c0_g1~~TRINITY_DN5109_c0_g1_i1.p1  ORF type:complete len:194 (+),score=14.43 TRINITY_DN5109_c0_g1_i1:172-753(+)
MLRAAPAQGSQPRGSGTQQRNPSAAHRTKRLRVELVPKDKSRLTSCREDLVRRSQLYLCSSTWDQLHAQGQVAVSVWSPDLTLVECNLAFETLLSDRERGMAESTKSYLQKTVGHYASIYSNSPSEFALLMESQSGHDRKLGNQQEDPSHCDLEHRRQISCQSSAARWTEEVLSIRRRPKAQGASTRVQKLHS